LFIALLFLFAMTVVLLIVAYRRDGETHIQGLKTGAKMLKNMFPLLILAFILAGFIQVAVPPEMIKSWLGEEAGWKGIVIGTFAGALIPGGPYVTFPIFAAIFQAGAGIGTAVALITGWAMLGVGQLPFELALLGPRFTVARLATVFWVPFIAGAIAQYIFG